MKSAFASVIGFGIGNLFSRIGLSQETGNSNKNAELNGVFIEAGSFDEFGGWILDTQFIEIMGSTYLMAHGLGKPVPDAKTRVNFPETGKWRVWVRTKDWVARWNSPGAPGRFQLLIDNKPVEEVFGTKGAEWHWHDGGIVEIDNPAVTISLHDLTGFNGRCDAIYFSKDLGGNPPPDDNKILPQWRKELLGLTSQGKTIGVFDLVVAGGGYAGMCAALSASRMGLKVALIQNRPVFGGNASSEIHVPLRGLIPKDGPYPHIGEIVEEIQYDSDPDARLANFRDDAKYEAILSREKNITLFLFHHAWEVEMNDNHITGVKILDTRDCSWKLIKGRYFADCTGHATLGALSGADSMIGSFSESEFSTFKDSLMGMTNKWLWEMTPDPEIFPQTPWALDLTMKDFPLHSSGYWGTWAWEGGYYRHPINDLEYIRDWNFRAVFGAWNAVKNKEKASEYINARLAGLVAIGGPRESRRLLGDYVLTGNDMINRVEFDDGFVPVTWYLDRHFPDEKYNKKYPDDPFIARADHKFGTNREDRPRHGAPWWGIPYRCLYSRNISNLFMAGRNISTNYWALGAVRVMRTCGMMGEIIGKAASVCVEKNCQPGDVYYSHLSQLRKAL